MSVYGCIKTDNVYDFDPVHCYDKYGWNNTTGFPISTTAFRTNTRYKFSFWGKNRTYNADNMTFRFIYTDGTKSNIKTSSTIDTYYELISDANKTVQCLCTSYDANYKVYIHDAKLEEYTG